MKELAFLAFVVCLLMVVPTQNTRAETTSNDVEQELQSLGLQSAAEIMSAIETGFLQGRLTPDEMVSLLSNLAAYSGEREDKEILLLTIARALKDDSLPVTMLIDKVEEGLARKVSLQTIRQMISGRANLLAEVRDLLYMNLIFTGSEYGQENCLVLPLPRFDFLVTQIADTLANYQESGRSPLEGYLIYEEMRTRLSMLQQNAIIPAEDVELILERIKPESLTHILSNVLSQQQQ